MVKPRLTGGGIGPVSLQWEYVEANRDVVRRVVTTLEDKAVLYELRDREDAEFCRRSAQKVRDLLTLEIPNVSEGGEVERAFKKMRSASHAFVRAAGPRATAFTTDSAFFRQCLEAFRVTLLDELAWMVREFKLDVVDDLAAVLPQQDLGFIPGFDPASDDG